MSHSSWIWGRMRSDLTGSEVLACLGMVLRIIHSTKIRVSIRTKTKGEPKFMGFPFWKIEGSAKLCLFRILINTVLKMGFHWVWVHALIK